MFGAKTKEFFAKYFQKDKSQFSQRTVQLIYMSDKLLILVFVTNYLIS